MHVDISTVLIADLVAEAARCPDREVCGILLGAGSRIAAILPTPNIHPEPERHFTIDPQSLIDAHRSARSAGRDVVGYYHSHPNGLRGPSSVDCAMAHSDGKIWAIVAGGEATFWRDGPGGFVPLPIAHLPV